MSHSCSPVDCSPPGPSVHGDSPGKNTGVGCQFLLQGIFPTPESNPGLLHCSLSPELQADCSPTEPPGKPFLFSCSVAQSCLALCDPVDHSLPRSSVHGDSPGKNIGVGCHAFLQGISPTQKSNPGLPHCRWIRYCQGSPQTQLIYS